MEKCPQADYINRYNEEVEKVKDDYFGYGILVDIDTQSTIVQSSQIAAKSFYCPACDGMAVNIFTGELGCGLDTPQDIAYRN